MIGILLALYVIFKICNQAMIKSASNKALFNEIRIIVEQGKNEVSVTVNTQMTQM